MTWVPDDTKQIWWKRKSKYTWYNVAGHLGVKFPKNAKGLFVGTRLRSRVPIYARHLMSYPMLYAIAIRLHRMQIGAFLEQREYDALYGNASDVNQTDAVDPWDQAAFMQHHGLIDYQ